MYPTERKRYIILGAAIGAVFLFFVVVMMLTQLRDGEDYARQAAQGISITQQTSAARGEIVDATGKAFTGNTTICNITIDSNYFTEQELNPLLLTLTALCRDYGCEWRDELPISTETPYTFTGEEAALRALRGKLQLSEAATPEDALYWLRELYNLNDYTDTDVLDRLRSRNKIEDLSDAEALDWLRNFRKTPDATDEELLSSLRTQYRMYRYTQEEQRLLAGIRYTMTQSEFSSYNPYTFATDISDALLAAVKESSSRLPGVDGVTVPVRTYLTGSLASHVLGVTGSISSEEYNKLKEAEKTYSLSNPSGYRISDTLGKSGIERVMEDELRGQNGLRTVVQDQEGNVIRVEETEEAVPGHTVQLTLVQSVQAAAQKALADRISYLNNNAPATRGKEAEAGAVVAIDVKTGGVIAMASYPDYSLDEYYQTYSEMVRQSPSPLLNRATQGLYTVGSTYKPAVSLAALDTGTVTATDRISCTDRISYPDYSLDEYYQTYSEMVRQSPSPLLNRATQGLYTVGSTYKPAVSLAALDTGTVTATDRISCTGRYTYYRDYQPVCEGVHGPINVIDALRVSCNIFFYDMGRRMGIETINEYSYSLGLGHATGIEIPELAGQLSSPETRAAIGEDWYDSYDLQSAIGQLDNQFTILQMASYTATLASRGQRMQVHLVDKIWDYNMKNVLYEAQPTVVETIEADDSTWAAIQEGMTRSCYNDRYGRGTSYGTWGSTRGKTWSMYGVDIVVAGKTGSPQRGDGLVNSCFICYAPADDPQIAVAVIIEKGYEGDRAAPVAKAVLEEYFFGEDGIYHQNKADYLARQSAGRSEAE